MAHIYELLTFIFFLVVIVLFQFLSLFPIKKIGASYLQVVALAPSFLIITSSLSYHLNNVSTLIFPISFSYLFGLALLLEYLFLHIFVRQVPPSKKSLDFVKRNSEITIYEFLSLFFILTLFLLLFNFFYPINEVLKFGDFDDFISVTKDLVLYDQEFFRHVYSTGVSDNSKVGLFYPTAGFVLGAIAVEQLSISFLSATIYSLYFASFYSYILIMFLIAKYLKTQKLYIVLISLIMTNVFPLALIFSGNLSLIYGVIGSICLMYLLLITLKFLSAFQRVLFIVLSILILIPLHPSSAFTFVILIWSYSIILESPIIKKIPLKITGTLLIIGVSTFIILILTTSTLNNILNLRSAFFGSLPSRTTLSEFYKEESIYNRLWSFYWSNVFTLSVWAISIPVFFILVFLLSYSIVKWNKPLKYSAPLLFYLFFISSASISGIQSPISILSIFTIPYYQSPIRLTHLGVMIYFLYLVKFMIDKEQGDKVRN